MLLIMMLKNYFKENKLGIYLVPLVLVLQILSTLQTNKPRFFCGPVVTKFDHFHISVLCDSSHYLLDAQNLKRLFFYSIDPSNFGSPLQDRPLAPLLANFISFLIRQIPGLDSYEKYTGEDNLTISYSLSVYLAYLVLNFLILYSTIIIALTTIKSKSIGINCIIVVYLSFNQLTQNYFWIPNTVLMNNLFAVVIVRFLRYYNSENEKRSLKYTCLFTFLGLYYPLFFFGAILILLLNIISKNYALALILTIFPFSIYTFYIFIINSYGEYVNNPSKSGYFSLFLDVNNEAAFFPMVLIEIEGLLSSFSIIQIFFFIWVLFSWKLNYKYTLIFFIYLGYIFSLGVFDYRYNVGLSTYLFLSYLASANLNANKMLDILRVTGALIYMIFAFLFTGFTY